MFTIIINYCVLLPFWYLTIFLQHLVCAVVFLYAMSERVTSKRCHQTVSPSDNPHHSSFSSQMHGRNLQSTSFSLLYTLILVSVLIALKKFLVKFFCSGKAVNCTVGSNLLTVMHYKFTHNWDLHRHRANPCAAAGNLNIIYAHTLSVMTRIPPLLSKLTIGIGYTGRRGWRGRG